MSVVVDKRSSEAPGTVDGDALDTQPSRATQATLILVGSLVVMATAVIAPALPAIQTYFADDPRAGYLVRLLVTLPALVIAVTAPFAGYFLDRGSRRAIVLWALVGFVGFGTAGVLTNSLEMLLLTRAGLGLSVAFLMAGFTSLIGDLFEPRVRGAIMSRQVSANSLISLSMIMAAGLFTELDWRAAFFIYLVAVPLVAAFWFFVPDPQRIVPAAPAGAASKSESNWGAVVAVYALALACPLIFLFVPTQSPFLIAGTHGGTSTTIAIALAFSTLGVLPGSLAFGRLRNMVSPWMLFALGFAIMGAGYIAQGMAPSLGLLIAAMTFASLGFGLIMPNLSTTLLAVAPPQLRGRLSGGLVSSIFLGQFLSPILSQPFVESRGFEATFVLAGIVLCVVAAVTFAGARPWRRDAHRV